MLQDRRERISCYPGTCPERVYYRRYLYEGRRREKEEEKSINVLLILIVVILAVFVAFPLFWMVRSALFTKTEFFTRPPVLWPDMKESWSVSRKILLCRW